MAQSSLDIIDGGVGHAAALQHQKPICRRLGACFRFNEAFERDAVFDAGAVGQNARVSSPFWFAESRAQYSEEAVVAAAEENIAILGPKAGVWDNGC